MNPVIEYIEGCTERQQEIMFTLHDIFVEEFGLSPKIRFKIPFYYGGTWTCYVNPLKNGNVELCYVYANRYEDPTGLLDFKGRKMVAGIELESLDGIPLEGIYEITRIAEEYDKSLGK